MANRPASVSFVVFLTWLSAILTIISGLIAVISPDSFVASDGWSDGMIRAAGGIEIAIGLVVALVASALGKGSRFARLLVSAFMFLRLIASAFIAVGNIGNAYMWAGLITGALALLILYLLWNAKAGAFFHNATLVKNN